MYPNNTITGGYVPQTYPQIQNPYNYPNVQRPNQGFYNSYQSAPNQDVTQPVANSGLIGRMVESTEEIMPSEIRMDGSLGFFPMRDLSAIYVKQWDQNANLQTVRFIREDIVQKKNEANKIENDTNDQMATLQQILNQLGDIEDLLTSPKSSKKNKENKEE